MDGPNQWQHSRNADGDLAKRHNSVSLAVNDFGVLHDSQLATGRLGALKMRDLKLQDIKMQDVYFDATFKVVPAQYSILTDGFMKVFIHHANTVEQ